MKCLLILRHSLNLKPIDSLRLKHLCLLTRWVRLKHLMKRKRYLKHLLILKHSLNQKLIGSLRLKRLCFVIQKLTLRRIDSLKLRHSYLLTHLVMWIHLLRLKHLMKRKRWLKYLLTLRHSMNQKLIGSLRLKRLCFAIQRLTLRLIDSLKQRHWYLHFLIPIRSMN